MALSCNMKNCKCKCKVCKGKIATRMSSIRHKCAKKTKRDGAPNTEPTFPNVKRFTPIAT